MVATLLALIKTWRLVVPGYRHGNVGWVFPDGEKRGFSTVFGVLRPEHTHGRSTTLFIQYTWHTHRDYWGLLFPQTSYSHVF